MKKAEINIIGNENEIYKTMLKQVEALLSDDNPVITNLSNLAAFIKQSLNKVSWAGFYLASDQVLYLGPFQGEVACEIINFGDGVCGTAASTNKTIVVDNVHQFEGHIACDAKTNSEIVVPIILEEKVFGVLDLDSYGLSAFSERDKFYLEKIIELLKKIITLHKFNLT